MCGPPFFIFLGLLGCAVLSGGGVVFVAVVCLCVVSFYGEVVEAACDVYGGVWVALCGGDDVWSGGGDGFGSDVVAEPEGHVCDCCLHVCFYAGVDGCVDGLRDLVFSDFLSNVSCLCAVLLASCTSAAGVVSCGGAASGEE